MFYEEDKTIQFARMKFIETGVVSSKNIRPLVAKSWKRCYGLDPDVDPFIDNSNLKSSVRKFELRRTNNQDLISAASPIMQNICATCGKNFVLLSDIDGYIIEAESNIDYPLPIAVKFSEENIGTNAVGTALVEGIPLEIKGYEHYVSSMTSFHSLAMQIIDPDGQTVGILNITNPFSDLPPNIKLILKLGVEAIQNQLKWIKEQYWHDEAKKILSLISDIIEHCMLVFDIGGNIIDVNQKCVKFLLLDDREDIIGINLQKILKNQTENIFDSILQSQKFDILVNKRHISCKIVKVVKDLNSTSKTALLFEPVSSILPKKSYFTFGDILGEENNWLKTVRRAKKAAQVFSSVLIEGESGTGKEMIAQSIHIESGCNGLFVPVNCGAIPKDLIESELFGYEEGAFTGARKGGMKGKLEISEGGTLFLDEIGEMPRLMQVRLLRFLQDKILIRVGGSKSKRVNTRVIAATNRDLRKEVQEGRFREDLYYRLNVINIHLPSLKDRAEDIPLLIRYFIRKYCRKFKKDILDIDKSSLDVLCRYNWPGNVRELSNIIENIIIFTEGRVILPEDLPSYINDYIPLKPVGNKDLSNYEKQVILDAMEIYQGNISKVARKLGMARNTLYRKLRKLDISSESIGS